MRAIEFSLEQGDQVFSYWLDKELVHFNVSLLHRVRKVAPEFFRLIDIPLTEEIYDLCIKHRGIEEPRVERLCGKHLREPGYVALWNTDKQIPDYTVVDGHHRIVRRYRGGVRTMSFWASDEFIWRQILMPEYLLDMERVMADLPERPKVPTNIIHEVFRR